MHRRIGRYPSSRRTVVCWCVPVLGQTHGQTEGRRTGGRTPYRFIDPAPLTARAVPTNVSLSRTVVAVDGCGSGSSEIVSEGSESD